VRADTAARCNVGGQCEFAADVVDLDIEEFTHHEYAADVFRQMVETRLEQRPELPLL
jgi:hypothetical protein